jgi:hypothetical protein
MKKSEESNPSKEVFYNVITFGNEKLAQVL